MIFLRPGPIVQKALRENVSLIGLYHSKWTKKVFVLEAQPFFNKFFQQENNVLADDVTRAAILEDVIETIEIQEEDKTATEVSEDLDKKPPAKLTLAAEDLDNKPPAVPTVAAEVQVCATETKSSFVPIKNPYVTPQKATGVTS